MYAVYNYKAGSTAANVSADIIKLLTGETNLANLSADCVTANSSIVSTVAAGWTVHDAAAATNYQVITALCQDGTTPKYYRLGVPSATEIEGSVMEGWNATTHTATNSTMSGSSISRSSWAATSGGYFYIYATQKNIMMFSFHTSAYQVARGLQVVEHSRDSVPAGYPPFCVSYGSISSGSSLSTINAGGTDFAHPRYKLATAAGDGFPTNSGNYGSAACGFLGATPYNLASATFRDGTEASTALAYKVGVGVTQGGTSLPAVGYRHYGEVPDLRICVTSLGSSRDEITIDGKTYVLQGSTSGTWMWLIPKE